MPEPQNDNEIYAKSLKDLAENNDEIMNILEKSASELNDVLTNSQYISNQIKPVLHQLNSLNKNKVTIIDDDYSDKLAKTNTLVEVYQKEVVKIIAGLAFATASITDFAMSDEEKANFMNSLLQGASDYNLFWLAQGFVNSFERFSAFKGLAFLLAYGTDQEYEDGDYVAGDLTRKITDELGIKNNPEAIIPWMNTTTGTALVAVYEGLKYKVTDKGDWREEDWIRWAKEVISGATGYATWQALCDGGALMILSAAGLSVASAPEVVIVGIAAVGSMAVSKAVDTLGDYITGDNIIDKFTAYQRENGTYYYADKPENPNDQKIKIAVPRNGSGKDGSYDVLIDNYGTNKHYEIKGEPCTEQYYKKELYNNWEDVCEDVKKNTSQQDRDAFNQYLDKIKNAKTKEEREKIVESFEGKVRNSGHRRVNYLGITEMEKDDPIVDIYKRLNQKGFDIEEYINYIE